MEVTDERSRNRDKSEDHVSEGKRPELIVKFDYEYTYKDNLVVFRKGDCLNLLEKTNKDWWKVLRPGSRKVLFVPALYVEEKNGSKCPKKPTKYFNEEVNWTRNGNSTGHKDIGPGVVKPKPKERTSVKSVFSKSSREGISRNDSSRGSQRVESKYKTKYNGSIKPSSGFSSKQLSASLEELSKQIKFPGVASESTINLSTYGFSHPKFKPEKQLAEQKRSCYSTFGPQTCIEDDSESHKYGKAEDQIQHRFSRASNLSLWEDEKEIMSSKHLGRVDVGKLPPSPKSASFVRRISGSSFEEYKDRESGRLFYHDTKTKFRSWKPPRLQSQKSDENLAPWPRSTNSSMEKSLESLSISNECCEDRTCEEGALKHTNYGMNRRVSGGSYPSKKDITSSCRSRSCSYSDGSSCEHLVVSCSNDDSVPVGVSGGATCASAKGDEFNDSVIRRDIIPENVRRKIPEGWTTYLDCEDKFYCVNSKREKWFVWQDKEKDSVYFYDEARTKSVWELPPNSDSNNSLDESPSVSKSTTLESINKEEDVLACFTPEPASSYVRKRQSTGDILTSRSLKSKSLLVNRDITGHILDPSSGSIWKELTPPDILEKGNIFRTKITDNGKKVRKSWGQVYAALTTDHLTLWKDQKTFTDNRDRIELCVFLKDCKVEWCKHKSSRKNVFELCYPTANQILFQSDDEKRAETWFIAIKEVCDNGKSTELEEEGLTKLKSTESVEDRPVGESKSGSSIGRHKYSKSLKITTTSQSEDKRAITAHLRKFISNRIAKDMLVKKGIYKDEPVFGCSLEKLCVKEKSNVPNFVIQCIAAIEAKADNLKTDGIYRASGNLSQVQKLRCQVDQNNTSSLHKEDDVHILAGALKLFFREMKSPLIPNELFPKCIQAYQATPKKEKIAKFREILNSLPKHNRSTLEALLKHLLKVADYSEYNRMQIPNLAIVFGPSLMWLAQESSNHALELTMEQNFVIEALLTDFDAIFR